MNSPAQLHLCVWFSTYVQHTQTVQHIQADQYTFTREIRRWFTVYSLVQALVVGIILGVVMDEQSNSVTLTVVFFVNFAIVLILRPMVSSTLADVHFEIT